MASRLPIKEDISENNDKNIEILQESTSQNNNLDKNDQTDTLHTDSKNTHATEMINEKMADKTPNNTQVNNNHEVEDNTANISNVTEENSTKNTTDDAVENSNDEVPAEKNGITLSLEGVKQKLKKKLSELELLGVDTKTIAEWDAQFDASGAESQLSRKYKLRKVDQQVSYKEPANFPLERCRSSAKALPCPAKAPPRPEVPPADNSSSLTCPTCEQTFDSKRALHLHVRYHGNTTREFKCSICSENFNNNADLIAHKVVHSSESFVCESCKLAFSNHCDYLLHNVIHAGTEDIQCPECGLQYGRRNYSIHIKTHFSKKSGCNSEKKLVNKTPSSKFECIECGLTLKNKARLDYHMIMHTGVKIHQCLYCGRCFSTPSMRNVHMRVHTGERPFSCDICGYKGRQHTDLKRHRMTHANEKKFSCELCPKKFRRKESVVTHMSVHTKTDLYECPVCDHKVTTSTGIKMHMLMKHTKERPVECTVCNKRFINNNLYKQHTRSKIHMRHVYGHMKQLKTD
ncbi:zinc finger protein ZFP2 [Helicoverpa armigera]|uniref:zinc finger protein ZFP2 n=1 Tax=Helicoverpa armigera TaxID=29058 RepID=UPI0030828C3B